MAVEPIEEEQVADPGAPDLEIKKLRRWIGRVETGADVITPRLEASFRATLDRLPTAPQLNGVATLGIHWCLAPSIVRSDALAEDGHPRLGAFLPPVPLPRRMWAGGELVFHAPLEIGDQVTRTSRIEDVVFKTGRSGKLCFVTVRHNWETSRGLAIDERQDIVYRSVGATNAIVATQLEFPDAGWQQVWKPDPVLLFRYSALTFNGHRIHYDRQYVAQVEGHPDLVVHGPLQATTLLLLAADAQPLRRFSYRSVAPLFADGAFTANACRELDRLRLWVCDESGRPTMSALATS